MKLWMQEKTGETVTFSQTAQYWIYPASQRRVAAVKSDLPKSNICVARQHRVAHHDQPEESQSYYEKHAAHCCLKPSNAQLPESRVGRSKKWCLCVWSHPSLIYFFFSPNTTPFQKGYPCCAMRTALRSIVSSHGGSIVKLTLLHSVCKHRVELKNLLLREIVHLSFHNVAR